MGRDLAITGHLLHAARRVVKKQSCFFRFNEALRAFVTSGLKSRRWTIADMAVTIPATRHLDWFSTPGFPAGTVGVTLAAGLVTDAIFELRRHPESSFAIGIFKPAHQSSSFLYRAVNATRFSRYCLQKWIRPSPLLPSYRSGAHRRYGGDRHANRDGRLSDRGIGHASPLRECQIWSSSDICAVLPN